MKAIFVFACFFIFVAFGGIPHEDRGTTCTSRPAYGDCRGHTILWYYDYAYNNCDMFTYSNCGGNLNRFYSREECEDFCKDRIAILI